MSDKKEIVISGIKLNISNYREELHMNGPWLGDLYYGPDLISKDCIVDNILFNEHMNILFFVKLNHLSNYGWLSLSFYDFKSKTGYQFYKEFEMLYLKEFISENEIHVYNSFNNGVGNNFYFKLDEEEFFQIN